ncbi:MAG: arabinogalactan endo-beta-1,4-galactanase [Candidatus Cryptobacteroides sp.]
MKGIIRKTALAAFAVTMLACSCDNEVPGADKPSEGDNTPSEILKGGDISELTYVEQNGGRYYLDGKEMDCVKLLASEGFNIVRLRLYNDPGNSLYSPSNRLPKGIQDEADILSLARRAKAEGLKIELTFHYSDYWTNGKDQVKPHAWSKLDLAGLKKAVYTYTKDFLKKMEAQGTLPEYVSLGNETQAGMLYPEGSVDNMENLCAFYSQGAKAVREVAPEARIIIHSDDAGSLSKYSWLFGELRGVDYDIIGASYYPFWTGRKVSEIISWAKTISASFDKDILIMETGYAWNPTLPDGTAGQISNNGPYNDMTKEGQKAFMKELFDSIKGNPDARIIGVLYWDPIFIPAGDAGWELGAKNVVSNTTLFDFEGNALPVFESFK